MRKVFLDTCGILALVNSDDNLHIKAVEVNNSLLLEKTRFYVTDYVLTEVANALSKRKLLGIKTINCLLSSEDTQFVRIDKKTFDESIEIYRKYSDKQWGLTDISSFIIMKRFNIWDSLTHDKHFQQFGFNILL